MNLKKKVGPLPVWAWGAAVAVGILIYYMRNKSASAVSTVAAQQNPTAQLDPTQGSFDMPSGLSSGGTSPVTTGPDLLTEIQDVGAAMGALQAIAPAPGAPQDPTTGNYDPVGDTVNIIHQLASAGLIAPVPANTGAAAAPAQSHTGSGSVATRVNKSANNPRKGQTYKVVTNPKGSPKGVYHVYNNGKKIRVKK